MGMQFTPKTALEREAFLAEADSAKAGADLEEARLRREL